MIEETTSESITSSVGIASPKVHRVALYNRLAIMISGGFIALSLLIGWVVWLTAFRTGIDYYITVFNTMAPNTLKMSFEELSTIVFAVSAFAISLVVIPFVFIRTKNGFSALFSLISFIFSTLLVVGFIVFTYIRFDIVNFLIQKDTNNPINTIGLVIAAFLPWALAALGALFLVGNSIWLLINISSKYSSNALIVPVVKPEKPVPVVEATPIPQESEISIPLATAQTETLTPTSQQPITITVTNNSAFPDQQSSVQSQGSFGATPNISTNDKNIPDSQATSTPTYTRTTAEASNNTGAYVSEAVVSNQNQTSNIQNNPIRLADPMLENSSEPEVTLTASTVDTSIYSRTNNEESIASSSVSKYDDLADESKDSTIKEPEILSNAPNPIAVSYEPQNQGGFDVQGAAQGQPDDSKFGQEKQVAKNHEQKTQSKSNMKQASTPKSTSKFNINHWTLDQIQTVWEKAETIDGVSDKLYRKDYAGAWMFRDSFTNDLSEANNEKTYSWTIVLHRPASQSGTTELYNLDPMNIVNAKNKAENYPRWTTKLSSKGNENVIKEQNWKART
ncbi:hypothetical protein [Spiroplasma endosymbiont of Virgichneumon dumeticola]|uniref:hypothetical protein n=1 Tax=Spiroplasma endosymbiont of Virgichneumon dumeticola TaxID=3139323 RepID=UPI0035C9021D